MIKGMDKAQKRLKEMAKKYPHVTRDAMRDATYKMILPTAIDRVTNAGPALLNRKTGALASAIRANVSQFKETTIGTVGIPKHVDYGRTHEFGFTGNVRVKAHRRKGTPVRAHTKFLRLRKRPWLSGAYKLRKRQIEKRFERITQDLLKAART